MAKIYENSVLNYEVTSGFGERVHPISGLRANHDGIDIISRTNDYNIYALEDGYVQKVVTGQDNADSGYGNYIWVRYPRINISLFYAHCKSIKLKKGDLVSRGTIIAIMGSTGASTGIHLHLGMTEIGSDKWLNPETYNYVAQTEINNIVGVDRDNLKNQIKVLVDGLRVRSNNSLNSEVVGFALKNNIYDFYEVIKDGEYIWYMIGENRWVCDIGNYLDIYYIEENYKEKYESLLLEYNELKKYKFKYLVGDSGDYKIKLNKGETLIIK